MWLPASRLLRSRRKDQNKKKQELPKSIDGNIADGGQDRKRLAAVREFLDLLFWAWGKLLVLIAGTVALIGVIRHGSPFDPELLRALKEVL
jgi:hypothetical protein